MISMSIKAYAQSHKLSIYNVVKMTKNGTLKTELKKVNGIDEIFVLENENIGLEAQNKEDISDYEKAYFKLKLKYNQLQQKYENLQKKI
ncbi:MAG TPA: hypothetical protein EYO73_08220 [Sulfurimonas sp.]|nr:hypothetical protein [Sulfurimonas sp.]